MSYNYRINYSKSIYSFKKKLFFIFSTHSILTKKLIIYQIMSLLKLLKFYFIKVFLYQQQFDKYLSESI